MSFAWTAITAAATIETAAIWNQLKTNTDHCTTQLGIAAYSWVHWNVTQYSDTTTKTDMDEMRAAIDYVKDNNVCVSNNNPNNAVTNSAANAGNNTGVK